MTQNRAIEKFYPEVAAGGFSRVDGTVAFYLRVNALVKPDMTVLDLGAGRGSAVADRPSDFKTGLRNFRGKCRKVIGADVDPVVRENQSLDEAAVIGPDGRIPLADGSVDLVFSDFTFEHVADPARFATEIDRLLKPGGWLCARTPNKWGYIAVGARLVPNRSHVKVLGALQPHRKKHDVFPTVYRLNTFGALRRYFPDARWERYAYTQNPEPAYFSDSTLAWGAMIALFKLLPARLGSVLLFFARKKALAA
ncbi:MAG TPA: class I SAM-dependent methyltransferase [Candidatus Binataceae bacterium]|nr:class I SAM-dependent methyltransferase [Candidatus Binataceae bacterium]